MRSTVWTTALGLGSLTVGLGCKTGDQPVSKDVAPSATVSPTTKLVVRANDCAAWSDHAANVIADSFASVTKACPQAGTTEEFAAIAGGRVEMRAAALELCKKHVGEEFLAADSSCFTGAKTVEAMFACRFAPMSSPGDTDLGKLLAKTRKDCGLPADKGGPL
ncbi:MAG: hypothetical protein ACXVEF_33165 [Polyangiales bacterium]